MASSKKMYLSLYECDFKDKETDKLVKGFSIKFLEKHKDTGDIKYQKEWIPFEYITDNIRSVCKSLIPGQEIDFDYSLDGRKIYVSDVIPGDMIFDIQKNL